MRGYGREPRDFFRPRMSERHFLWCMVGLFVVGLVLLAVVPGGKPWMP